MISVSEIREKLNQVIEDKLALDDFEDWIVGSSWDMHLDSDPVAQAFVSAVELRLAEYSNGHLPLAQMIEEFRGLLTGRFVLHVRLNAEPIVHCSGSSISPEQVRILPPLVGTRPLTVCA